MAHRLEQVFGRFLTAWIDGVGRRSGGVLALAVAATAAVGFYAATTLGFNTETTDMIDEALPFRQAAKAYDRAFPQFSDNLVVVVEGDTPGLAEDGAEALARGLEDQPGVFETVYRPGGDPFFTRNGLLYLDLDALGELADNLAGVQPLIGKLIEDTSLRGLFTILEEAVDNVTDGEAAEFDLADAFDRLSDAVEAALAGRRHHLSWQEVISGETASINDRRRFIVLQPRRDFTRLAPDEASIEAVRALARELALVPENGVRVRLTGSVALSHDQLTAAGRGAALAAPVAFILVGLVL
ncbi:MAG: hopanoid biosynthesis-associated RND transporter HpnN, partial [Proteobacteria bacterium]|nr:hopanoid biosynthesis-associated RND transporter HpnN [Pseudomonadota bacterium]